MTATWHSIEKALEDITEQVNRETERSLQSQLNELLSRGLLEIRKQQPTLILEPGHKVSVRHSVELVLKNQEYVEALEKERDELKAEVAHHRKVFAECHEIAKRTLGLE